MNVKSVRNVRWAAAIVICSGALALNILSPPTAGAVTCPTKYFCSSLHSCLALSATARHTMCARLACGPTKVAAVCLPAGPVCSAGGLACYYT